MSEREIQRFIKSQKRFAKAFIPNLFFNDIWEADLIHITNDFKVIEYEIKRSKQDFKADFGKESKHSLFNTLHDIDPLPNYFYFVCEQGIIPEEEVPEYAGLLYIVKAKFGMQKYLKTIKPAPMLHNETISYTKWRELAIKMANRLDL